MWLNIGRDDRIVNHLVDCFVRSVPGAREKSRLCDGSAGSEAPSNLKI